MNKKIKNYYRIYWKKQYLKYNFKFLFYFYLENFKKNNKMLKMKIQMGEKIIQ